MDPIPPYSGRRKVTKSGNSLVVSLPKDEMSDVGIDPEEIESKRVRAQLTEEGEYRIDLAD